MMDTPTNYLIATSVCLAFAYLIYLLFFRKETNFRQRRFFLIFAAVFSLLLPTGSYYILLPLTTNAETQTEVIAPSPVLESPVPQIASSDFHSVNPGSVPDTEPVKKRHSIDLLQALQYLYVAGIIVLLLRFIVQLVTIRIWYSRSRKVKQPMFTLLFHERFSTPFSFFKWIFLTEKRLPETDFEKIIAHESVHVKQRHSFDAVFFELLCIFMWFNPFVWMMSRSINLTHEFLADEGAIQSGIDSLHYQALMVNQVAEANIVSVTSHFNKSLLSQRIKMIANSRLYKKAKYKILVLVPVALVLFLFIAGVNGLDKRKVLYRNLKKDPVISKVFSKDEIKDLVELRLMTDAMVVNTTREPDTKIAYPKFNELLSGKETVSEVKEKITLSHDSLVTVVKSHPALLEIYDVSNSNNMSFSINRHGKVMEFLQELSKQNAVYKEIRETIEIAGDVSPSTVASLVNVREKYNMESEAERLYASIIYGILTNRILKRGETGDIHRSSTYAHIDTELLRQRFRAYQKKTSDRNAELLYEALPEKGHIKLEDSEMEVIGEIADNLMTLEKQVLKGQRNSVKVAFRMFTISDGAFTEWLQIMLGNLITENPEMFLEELKTHLHLCRELPIYNLGPDYVDDIGKQMSEISNRTQALKTVTTPDLNDIRDECLSGLQSDLKGRYKMLYVNPIVSKKLPELNSYLADSIRQASNHTLLMVSSSQLSPSTRIKVDGIMFNIAWDLNNKVSYITTTDTNFSTAEGVWINMTLKELKKLQEIKIFKMPGWGYYASLNSGWSVGFSVDETMTGRELVDSDSVKWIFKKPGFKVKSTNSQEKGNQQEAEKESNSILEDAEVIINDPDNYSTDFMAGLYNLPEEYKKIEVRREILILNDTIFETLPDFLFSGKTYKMEGTDGNVEVTLSFTQNTYSSIDYVVQVSQNGEPEKQFAGVAELQASFFLGGKTETDNEKNEVFTTLQLVDNNKALPLFIDIGKDGLFQLRCKVEYDDFKSPVLRSKNNEILNQPPLSKNHIGDLRKMNVQKLFAHLRFKSTGNSMADPDEEKFIVYGETYGNDLISGIRLDVRNWLSYDDLKFLMSNLESQEPCKSMMSVFSSWRPDVESTIGGFAALFLDYYRKNQLFHPLVADPTNNPDLVQELKEWWGNYNNENTRK